MVTYYNTAFYVYRFPLTRTYMGGANYLKMSQQIINAWKTAFTIPTEKLVSRATPPDWGVWPARLQISNVVWRGPLRLVVHIPLPSLL